MKSSLINALTLLEEDKNALTTGYDDIDGLIGGLKRGQTYLFYGDTEFISELLHKLIVVVSKNGKIAYMNNTDYYSEKTIVNSDKIAFYAKREDADSYHVLRQVYFVAAFNELRQPKSAEALLERIKLENRLRRILTLYFKSQKENQNVQLLFFCSYIILLH
jgi:hypothetical protein